MSMEEITVTVCMGSSCYSKGSHEIVEALQEFMEASKEKLSVEVKLTGCLCLEKCMRGPMVKVGEREIEQATASSLIKMLKQGFGI